ncbi:unnamed protein product [Caenorhabditis auriculariae]|uniref:Protein kinase domain-containing protein n=1 Tax=Caenorhabditis auriculariae TaxID=2777116 RepID=A0A8S1H658_9PELO|nr:unnamed protein product [Caenorhabditis auriculariae]
MIECPVAMKNPDFETTTGRFSTLIECDLTESYAVGKFNLADKSEWTITGMKTKFDTSLSTDYEVYRAPRVFAVGKEVSLERIAVNKREYTMRLCRFDDSLSHEMLLHEVVAPLLILNVLMFWMNIMKRIREENSAKHVSQVAPQIVAFGRMPYLDFMHSYLDRHEQVAFSIPRPFYIMERLNPALDTASTSRLESSRPCAYSIEWATAIEMCSPRVSPLRLHCNSFLRKREAELSGMVVLTDLGYCRQFKGLDSKKPRRDFTVTFSTRYSSPEAMQCIEQTSQDDLVSALYIFFEFVTGSLPWSTLKNFQEILNKKMEFELIDEYGTRDPKDVTVTEADTVAKAKKKTGLPTSSMVCEPTAKAMEMSGVKAKQVPEKTNKKEEMSRPLPKETAEKTDNEKKNEDRKTAAGEAEKDEDEKEKPEKESKQPPPISDVKKLFEQTRNFNPYSSECSYFELYKELVSRIPEKKESFSLFPFLSRIDAVYMKAYGNKARKAPRAPKTAEPVSTDFLSGDGKKKNATKTSKMSKSPVSKVIF